MRSSRLIFSGCGEDSTLESTGCSFGGLTETGANTGALVLYLYVKVYKKMMSWPCNARWYLNWSRAVLLSWGLWGGLSSEEQSPEVATLSWGARRGCLSGDSSGNATGDTTTSIRGQRLHVREYTYGGKKLTLKGVGWLFLYSGTLIT